MPEDKLIVSCITDSVQKYYGPGGKWVDDASEAEPVDKEHARAIIGGGTLIAARSHAHVTFDTQVASDANA